MHNRCDVHVIVSENHKEYHEQCFDSLKEEPINLHVIPGTDGHIGIGRYRGFHSGCAEFMSYVDDDDYIIPGIFEKCYAALDENPDAVGVVTKESPLKEGRIIPPVEISMDVPWRLFVRRMHHLVVYRRSMVMPYVEAMKDQAFRSEYLLLIELLASGRRFALVDEVGYIWRLHKNQVYNKRHPSDEVRNRVMELLKTCDM